MQVSVEKTQGLGRKMKVSVPAEQFEAACDQKIKSLAKTTKMAGFRPGKVPINVIKQKYGKSVRQEIMADMVQRSYGQALGQEKLNPAGLPHIDSKPPAAGEDMEYIAEFEVYPEFAVADLGKLKVSKAEAEVGTDDIDSAIEKLRKQRASWKPVERAAKSGDQLKIDFVGTIDGEAFSGGTANDVPLVLGDGQMIPGFEDQLEGISTGEKRDLNVTFPKDYGQESLQGKEAVFAVECKEVAEQEMPELDEEFAKSFGAEDGSIDAFKEQIETHLKRECEQHVRAHQKEQIMDGLVKLHKLELPNVLVDSEIQQLQKQAAARLGMKEVDVANLPREGFEERARQRVHLGLVVAKVVEENDIKADEEKVRQLVAEAVSGYENPEQMIQYYMSNREAMQHFQSMAIEEQVVDFVLEKAKISSKKMTFDELVNRAQQ